MKIIFIIILLSDFLINVNGESVKPTNETIPKGNQNLDNITPTETSPTTTITTTTIKTSTTTFKIMQFSKNFFPIKI
jgi:hypothetical protein